MKITIQPASRQLEIGDEPDLQDAYDRMLREGLTLRSSTINNGRTRLIEIDNTVFDASGAVHTVNEGDLAEQVLRKYLREALNDG